MTPKFADESIYWTPQFAGPTWRSKKSPLVFVGYGVVAPEYHWNDYAGMDVKGKTVVILINDPGNEDAHPDPKFFKGKAMTYYGRWTYKYEEAARQGAAAAIIVHETMPAAYGWQVVRNSNCGAKSWLDAADKNKSMLPIQGWITLDTAKDLFTRAGLDYRALKAAANKPGFKAVAMTGEALDVDAHSTVTHLKTRNVVGVIPGTKHPSDVVIFSAHWDHLGRKPDVAGPDKIYNGAVDNGMGVAQVLELAEKFAHEKRPQRSIVFALLDDGGAGPAGFGIFRRASALAARSYRGRAQHGRRRPEGRGARHGCCPAPASRNWKTYLPMRWRRRTAIALARSGAGEGPLLPLRPFQPGEAGHSRDQPRRRARPGGRRQGGGQEAARRLHRAPLSPAVATNGAPAGTSPDRWKTTRRSIIVGGKLANDDAWPGWYAGSEFKALRDQTMAGRR